MFNLLSDQVELWKEELQKINTLPQRQDSTNDQLLDLITIAYKFGMYDAADFIKKFLKMT